ncbi:ATP-binding cassette domain-containing protein [Variovorax sp. MHTC-1]|uniref:ATP-binding cassette domain-containing protein n=1 Tax=Variovorax sp. MHTC-1 TaxID=2495593 RepID=UPI0021B0644A|nr:ATP-binding cassette domain-containing protein [Variovorax sp. MHTC-1]
MLGPNGSGKTTLFELMTGSNSPSAGRYTPTSRTTSTSCAKAASDSSSCRRARSCRCPTSNR